MSAPKKQTFKYFTDQEWDARLHQRIRFAEKALRGSAEENALLQRYTRQLDEQEPQLDELRKKNRDTETQRDKANERLEKIINELQIEATM